MKVYLYRKSNAIGVATHWSEYPIYRSDLYELMGIGELVKDKNGSFLDAQDCPHIIDIEQIQLKGN